MKLPDFTNSDDLNALRSAMGATELGTFSINHKPGGLTLAELEILSNQGIDVSIDEIVRLPDGTLGYKDSRVLVYIRDVPLYGDRFSLPKFHVAFCRTLGSMKANNRFGRYVVATRKDGHFTIHKITGNRTARSSEKLNVCQNCLSFLKYNGFDDTLRRSERKQIVNVFSIDEFFATYPKSFHLAEPKYDDMSAPINIYNEGFAEVGRNLKTKRGLICEKCRLEVPSAHSQFIETHHKDATKYNDDPDNLRLLCLRCHADEFNHGHMKNTPRYKKFIRLYPRRF